MCNPNSRISFVCVNYILGTLKNIICFRPAAKVIRIAKYKLYPFTEDGFGLGARNPIKVSCDSRIHARLFTACFGTEAGDSHLNSIMDNWPAAVTL